jgi:hypothetical protein
VLLLENLRFHAEEEKNDEAFSRALARLADVYVNDAFGTAHRAHASTVGMVPFVAERAAGFLLKRECEYLSKILQSPPRPVVAILGGAKVSDKIKVIRSLLSRVDTLLIGGAMAYTFLRAQGIATGRSLVEEEQVALATSLLADAEKRGVSLLLPIDHVVAPDTNSPGAAKTVRDSGRSGRPRHRASVGRAVSHRDRQGADDLLERPSGHVRGAAVRRWNGGDRRRRRGRRRDQRDRWRRLRRCGHPFGAGRRHFAHFDRAAPRSSSWKVSLPGLARWGGVTATERRSWRKLLFCGRVDEALRFVDELLGLVGTVEDRDILVAPPFTALASVAQRVAGSRIQVSGQDVIGRTRGV